MLETAALASECRFAGRHDLNLVVAARLWECIDEAIEARGRAAALLAGGGTPMPVYNLLREMPLPWEKLTLCATDERWVAPGDAASNEGMLRRELLPAAGAEPTMLSLARRSDDPAADAEACERELAALGSPWDVALLGMGADGHTASWFPGAPGLEAALGADKRCVAVEPVDAEHSRLTLTRREILAARRILLLITGADKWRVYREALAANRPGRLPVAALLHQDRAPVDVYWCPD